MDSTRPLAVITGASSGIGAVFARKLSASHDLLLVARRRPLLEKLAGELSNTHTQILEADLAQPEDQSVLADQLANDPRLVLLVNNAGFGSKGTFWEASLE